MDVAKSKVHGAMSTKPQIAIHEKVKCHCLKSLQWRRIYIRQNLRVNTKRTHTVTVSSGCSACLHGMHCLHLPAHRRRFRHFDVK